MRFGYISVGRIFNYKGNDYVKQSSRTARMLSDGHVLYFRQGDIVSLALKQASV